ncbi:L domain-like protein [Lactarius psammicola]|nr:L domain-like protein [Lactarius psammicola]
MNRSVPSSSNGSSSPKPLKSRLPVSSAGTRPANSQLLSARVTDPSPLLTASPSKLRVPKSPSARPRTISSNAKPSGSSSPQPLPSDRTRTKSTTKAPPRSRPTEQEPATPSKAPTLSLKEAIALKRAEAKKAIATQKATVIHVGSAGIEDASPSTWAGAAADDDDLGRLSIRETIQRARSSGSLNIASRDLPCIPSALFEIHLSVTPDKLASVPEEPPLPEKPSRRATSNSTTWYDQQDLTFLRARNNQIVEIQHEISLFGSLKTIDLQHNRLVSLPESFADLTSLINLDLSHNALTSLPPLFFALPSLSVLDISHNSFAALPFNMSFDPSKKTPAPSRRSSDFYSAPEIVRATRPLPRLTSLDASHNKIVASAINSDGIPQDLKTFNLTYNPLGNVVELLTSLSVVTQLEELRMSKCDIDDASFPTSLLSSAANAQPFPKLAVLDLEETRVTKESVSAAFSTVAQTIDFETSINDPRTVPAGTLAVAVGKRIVREAWEIEADRHAQRLLEKRSGANLRAASAASAPAPPPPPPPVPASPQPVVKEQWEIDAEQGLLSEGAQRRARAEAAQRAADDVVVEALTASATDAPQALDRYWDTRSFTLTLPPSTGRSVRPGGGAGSMEPLPRATLPLALIAPQSFADTLRVLELRGRRAEPAFILPAGDNRGPLLPHLETLNLEGCALSNAVPGAEAAEGGTLLVLARLFPSLRNLELAYNDLTGAALGREALEQLLFASEVDGDGGRRAGLRRLCLCGNKIRELDGLRELAQAVFGAAEVEGEEDERRKRWALEELDIRENSITALAGELGLLPLDIFLVDGNLFRVPPRRVWEREGTKGLLTWLRGRLGN